MDSLRLDAVDADDLAILSAHCQDAVLRVADMSFDAGRQRFMMVMNRFVWEKAEARSRFSLFRRRDYERRRAALQFTRVRKVQHVGLDPRIGDQVLSLLALRFEEHDAPSGLIELVFAGGSAIRLDAECVEARLSDLDAAWTTTGRPDHDREEA
ncbi:MAG: DUF2948 family protein [Rhizobiaceae bacterium]|nr:DUF2948 family protein [Rhizobiaceae bacterium]